MEKVLVAGATGTTGKEVINILEKADGYTPVAMVRKTSQQSDFKERNIETVLADLTENVSHATKNIDKVVFAAGSKGENLKEVDQEGAKKLVDASKKDAVKKFVMLSSMGADNPEQADDLQDYLKAKKNADEYLKSSAVPYTIVRPGSLTNEDAKGRVKLSKQLNTSGEIPRKDVAKTLVESLNASAVSNETFELLSGEQKIEEALQQF